MARTGRGDGLEAGKLRHRVVVQEKVVDRNEYGEEELDWSDIDTVWAAVEPLRGREFIEAERAGAEVTTRIRLRYRSDITAAMRVTWNSHVYDIHSVINLDGLGRELVLMCARVG